MIIRKIHVFESMFRGCIIGSGYTFLSIASRFIRTSCSKLRIARSRPTMDRIVVRKSRSRHLLKMVWYSFYASKFERRFASSGYSPIFRVPRSDMPRPRLKNFSSDNLLR